MSGYGCGTSVASLIVRSLFKDWGHRSDRSHVTYPHEVTDQGQHLAGHVHGGGMRELHLGILKGTCGVSTSAREEQNMRYIPIAFSSRAMPVSKLSNELRS